MADRIVYLVTSAYLDDASGKTVGHQRRWTSNAKEAAEAQKDPTLTVREFTEAELAALAKADPRAVLKSGDPVAVTEADEAKLAQVVARDGQKPIPRKEVPPEPEGAQAVKAAKRGN